MKKGRRIRLLSLYLGYSMEKSTVLVLVISLIVLLGALFLISNPWLDKAIYLESYEDIHFNYFNQSLFIVALFNSLIIAMLSITLGINSISFDALFISFVKRRRICTRKLLCGGIVLFLLTLAEGLIIYLIPVYFYPKFKITDECYYLLLMLFTTSIVEFSMSLMLVTIIKSSIIPLMIAFLSALIRILTQSFSKLNRLIGDIYPIIRVGYDKFYCKALPLAPFWVIILALLYIGIYEIKDLKQNNL